MGLHPLIRAPLFRIGPVGPNSRMINDLPLPNLFFESLRMLRSIERAHRAFVVIQKHLGFRAYDQVGGSKTVCNLSRKTVVCCESLNGGGKLQGVSVRKNHRSQKAWGDDRPIRQRHGHERQRDEQLNRISWIDIEAAGIEERVDAEQYKDLHSCLWKTSALRAGLPPQREGYFRYCEDRNTCRKQQRIEEVRQIGFEIS